MYERLKLLYVKGTTNLKEIRTVINFIEISGMKTDEKDILLRKKSLYIIKILINNSM